MLAVNIVVNSCSLFLLECTVGWIVKLETINIESLALLKRIFIEWSTENMFMVYVYNFVLKIW